MRLESNKSDFQHYIDWCVVCRAAQGSIAPRTCPQGPPPAPRVHSICCPEPDSIELPLSTPTLDYKCAPMSMMSCRRYYDALFLLPIPYPELRPGNPSRFDRNGPYDILIDGANVAFYGQNRDGGGFRWDQIMSMVQLVKSSHPGKRVLLVRCTDMMTGQLSSNTTCSDG